MPAGGDGGAGEDLDMVTPTVRVFARGLWCHRVDEARGHRLGWATTACETPVSWRSTRDGSVSEVTCSDCLLRLGHTVEEATP